MFTDKSESTYLQAQYSATGRWPGGLKSSDWGTDLSWKTGESRSPPRESTIFMPRYCFSTLTVLLQLVCVTDKLPGWERCEWFPGKRVYFIQFYMCESAFCIFYVCESVILDTFTCVRMYSLHFFVYCAWCLDNFQIYVNDSPTFLCTAMTHTPTLTTKANTCYTGETLPQVSITFSSSRGCHFLGAWRSSLCEELGCE